jgi:hypothetical protein
VLDRASDFPGPFKVLERGVRIRPVALWWNQLLRAAKRADNLILHKTYSMHRMMDMEISRYTSIL